MKTKKLLKEIEYAAETAAVDLIGLRRLLQIYMWIPAEPGDHLPFIDMACDAHDRLHTHIEQLLDLSEMTVEAKNALAAAAK